MVTTAHAVTPRVTITEDTFAMTRKCTESATTARTTPVPLFVAKTRSDHTLGDRTRSAVRTGATIAGGK